MNHEKKLEYFAQAIAEEVEAKKMKARKQMAAEMDEAISRAVAEAETKAEQHIINGRTALQKAENKRISEAGTNARRVLASLREELTAKLLEDVKTDITAFTHSYEYEGYLTGSIQAAVANTNHTFQYVLLTPNDLRHGPAIQESTGLTPEPGDESDIGGFKLISANRGVAVDFTFRSRLASAADEFHVT